MTIMQRIGGMLRAAAVIACLAWFTTASFALDRVTLKDGKVIEGTIVREVNGMIFMKYTQGGIERQDSFIPSEISKIERDSGSAPKGEAATSSATPVAKANPGTTGAAVKPAKSGTPRAVVITLGDEDNGNMVGVYMTAHQLEIAIPELEKILGTDGSGVVVFRIHSGGGLALEVQKLSDVINNEYKKRWRTVAWIESAISAAAMTAHCLDEIYFTTQGNYGACTMFSGPLVAAKGRELEEVLAQMEKISARGNHDFRIMRAMQKQDPLSCTIDANGEVHWYQDATTGEILVNRPHEILTFNAVTAAKVKFSRGTADTLPELAKAMGYQELDWVGAPVKGVSWPVSQVEKEQMDFRKRVHDDEKRTREYQVNYNLELQAAQQAPKAERAKFIGRAKATFEKIKAMVRNNPNFSFMAFNMGPQEFKDWCEEQEKLFREMMR